MTPRDLRTTAFVLRRVNYGEADRIVTFLTPAGKISALAKGVRREKSKLAGNIELFCCSDITVHHRHTKSNQLGILTSARMQTSYTHILTDLSLLELASKILFQLNRATEHVTNRIYFDLAQQVFATLDAHAEQAPSTQNPALPQLVELWFAFNIAEANGEAINFYRDRTGMTLQAGQTYAWDATERALYSQPNGSITSDVIKLARLLTTASLRTVTRVQNYANLLPPLQSVL